MARTLRSALPFALCLSLASAAEAQNVNRGQLAVVGLRAPDGDTDAAGALTTALREAARGAGYTVANDTPGFDQEFAMVGCTSSSPECLSLIAGDIHEQKFIYGTVQRVGRGRDAQLSIQLNLWDETTHREIHREEASIARAQARPETLRELAQRMFVAIGNRDMAAQRDAMLAQQEEAARRAQEEELARQAQQQQQQLQQARIALQRRSTIQRSHVLRYVGFGVLGLGVVAGAVGIWQATVTSGQADATTNGTGDDGVAWRRYQDTVNPRRTLSATDVCSLASSQRDSNADAANAANVCDANSTSKALAYAFGVGGVVLAGVGAALVIIDMMNSSTPAQEGQPAQQPARQARLQVAPSLAPGYGGLAVGLTF